MLAANYPFATIEPNVGVVGVPDPRLAELAEIFGSAKVVPATVSFVDIAGIVRGASEGEGLGNKFLANIRESDAICQVVRAFRDPDVVHVDGAGLPDGRHRDDQHRADPRRPADHREGAAAPGEGGALDKGKAARAWPRSLGRTTCCRRGATLYAGAAAAGVDMALLRELHLLTAKPFIYVFNVDEDELADEAFKDELRALVAPAEAIFLDAKIEAELVELADDEALELLQSMGQDESGLDQLAHVGFRTLGLQTYLTAGPKESRAWTIHVGRHRPAGGRRHPHRLPARLHQGRGRLVRRPGRRPVRWPRRRPAARSASRARTT